MAQSWQPYVIIQVKGTVLMIQSHKCTPVREQMALIKLKWAVNERLLSLTWKTHGTNLRVRRRRDLRWEDAGMMFSKFNFSPLQRKVKVWVPVWLWYYWPRCLTCSKRATANLIWIRIIDIRWKKTKKNSIENITFMQTDYLCHPFLKSSL